MSNIRYLNLSTSGMAFDSRTGESFQLNDSAKFILESIQSGLSPEDVAQKVSSEFGIPYEQALTDVLEFQVQIHVIGVAA